MILIYPLFRIVRVALSVAIVSTLATVASNAASPSGGESAVKTDKTHHLFVGPDISITHEEEFVPIRKLSKRVALIDTPSRDRVMLGDAPRFSLKMAPKVSSNSAAITELISEETYSSGTDPEQIAMMDKLDQARTQSMLADQIHGAEQALSTRGVGVGFTANSGAGNLVGNTGATDEETGDEIDDVTSSFLDESQARQDSLANAFDFDGMEGGERPDYNALRVSFYVSSTKPMADAYAVFLVNMEHENETRGFTTYKRIGEVDHKPRRVKVFHEGLPPGYKIKSTQIFIYNHGEEIATNLSEKHYDITSSQARDFVKMNHRGMNLRDTVSAAPAWSLAPFVLQATDKSKDYDYSVTVELDAAGDLVSIVSNGQTIPDHVRAVLEETTFVPALDKGSPIASTLVVNAADFFKD